MTRRQLFNAGINSNNIQFTDDILHIHVTRNIVILTKATINKLQVGKKNAEINS